MNTYITIKGSITYIHFILYLINANKGQKNDKKNNSEMKSRLLLLDTLILYLFL